MKSFVQKILFVGFLLGVSGCSSKQPSGDEEDASPTPPAAQPPAQPEVPKPEFSLVLKPTTESIQNDLVKNLCVSCHTASTKQNRNVDLSDIKNVIEAAPVPGRGHDHGAMQRILVKPGCPDESFFYSVIKSGKMPPEPAKRVSEENLAVIRQWIFGLAPAVPTSCSDEPIDLPSDDPTEPRD